MAKKIKKKTTFVHSHPLHVPVSKKNPSGITIRDQHLRRLKGTYLDGNEITDIFKNYDTKNLIYPAKKRLPHKNSDKYDDLIAVWTDYFNKKFTNTEPLNPNVVKALIASESGLIEDPPKNKIAFGISQITPETLHILQDPDGEVKEFIFKNIRKKVLKNPNINIPMAVRWIYRKKRLAEGKLGRPASAEEIILEYKGLLNNKQSDEKKRALTNFRENYAKLKK